MKVCAACRQEKPLEAFARDARHSDGLRSDCKDCRAVADRAYREANRERTRATRRAGRSEQRVGERWRAYGLSRADFDALVALQSGACAICGSRPEVLHVDHDHATQLVRGLLCKACNLGLGGFRDDPETVHAAGEYLRNPPGETLRADPLTRVRHARAAKERTERAYRRALQEARDAGHSAAEIAARADVTRQAVLKLTVPRACN